MTIKSILSLVFLFCVLSLKAQNSKRNFPQLEEKLKRLELLESKVDSLEKELDNRQSDLGTQKDIKSFYESKLDFILDKSIDSSYNAVAWMLAIFSLYITVIIAAIGLIGFRWFKGLSKMHEELKEEVRLELKHSEQLQKEELDGFKGDYKLRMSELNYWEFTLQGVLAMTQSNSGNPVYAIRWMLSSSVTVIEKLASEDPVFTKKVDDRQISRLLNYLKSYIYELSLLTSDKWKGLTDKLGIEIFTKIDTLFSSLVKQSFVFNNEQYKSEVMQLMNDYNNTITTLNENLDLYTKEQVRKDSLKN